MSSLNDIIEYAKSHNGVVTADAITSMGLSRGFLTYLCEKGLLENVSRGVYIIPDVWEDEMFNFAVRFKKGVYSHETALFLLGLTDRTPVFYTMTFPKGYNLTKVKEEGLKCIQNKKEFYSDGIIQTCTPSGNQVNCYCMEKTLCDILRPRADIDVAIVTEAFKQYVKLKDRNIVLLSEYAKRYKVEDKVRSYLEVLL